jgi:aminoglycoside 6'-N-acetyltransferase
LNNPPAPTLHGERVTLRPVTVADRPRLDAILDEPDVARWWRRLEWERIVTSDTVTFSIEFDEEPDPDYRSASIDIFLATAVHSRGLGRDAVRTLARYLVEDRGHHRVTMDPAVENERAIRCYASVGFRQVGVMRQYEHVADGTYRDALLMELVAGDFAG